MQCPRCQQDNLVADAQFCPRCGAPVKPADETGPPTASYSDLLDQQTATREILRIISSSLTDVQPVFDTIVESAMQLFSAWAVAVFRYDGQIIRMTSARSRLPGSVDAVMEHLRVPHAPAEERPEGRAVLTRTIQHFLDVEKDMKDMFSWSPEAFRVRGFRSSVAVPMLQGDVVVGVITVSRQRVGGFAPSEISLLQAFADQAVIAIENVRLFTELQEKNRALSESLEQQTATSEILRVIASSPTDVQPVFDMIALNAVRLCDGYFSAVYVSDGERVHVRATHNLPPEWLQLASGVYPAPLDSDVGSVRVVREGRMIHVHDSQKSEGATSRRAQISGYRTWIGIPMVAGAHAIGTIAVARREERPFSDSDIALLKTFAAQAVIAIENVRLFTELQSSNRGLIEALDKQTATSDILRAISASPIDVHPVFEAIGRNAVRLCNGVMGAVFRFDGEFMHIGALHGYSAEGEEATRQAFPTRPERRMLAGRAVLSRAIVHVPDVTADPEFEYGALASTANWRSLLVVPMLREGKVLGTVGVSRAQAGPFTDQEIALLQTFADQAVIAIENVRLFTELQTSNKDLREALDTQTATSDILRVISKSPTDLQPVFDPLLDSAVRLCGATHASLYRLDGDVLHHVAGRGSIQGPRPVGMRGPIPHGTAPGRAILTGETVQVLDAQEEVAGMPPDAREYVVRAGCPDSAGGATPSRRLADWCHCRPSHRGSSVCRSRDAPPQYLRRPSGDRYRECPIV